MKDINVVKAEGRFAGYVGPVEFSIFISNEGRYIAKETMLILRAPSEALVRVEMAVIGGGTASDISEMNGGKQAIQVGLRNSIYYPTITTRIGTLNVWIRTAAFDELVKTGFELAWSVYAEDMPVINGLQMLNPKQVIKWA